MTNAHRRDAALDIARGLIMVLMALDHTRMYFSSATFDPVTIGQTTPAYFATRWVTHLCAPGFFFLAGLGASLAERAGMSGRLSSFWLASRGLWLLALEFTLIAFAWSFTLRWSWIGVIASLGASMICLAALRWAPKAALGAAALLVIVLHNAFPVSEWISSAWLSALAYGGGVAEMSFGDRIMLFPIAPWLAVMVAGYAFGAWLTPGGRASPTRFAAIGAVLCVAFVSLRYMGFGEPAMGGSREYASASDTIMSFFNVEKYPPSLQYLCATLGVLFLLIAAFGRLHQRAADAAKSRFEPLLSFGRVPFFFYLLHLYVIHGLALLVAWALGWPTHYLFWRDVGPNLTPPDGYGLSLWGVYGVLALVLAILYPLCAAFAALKARSNAFWLKYF